MKATASKEIATSLLPQHRANLVAIHAKATALADVLDREEELRRTLQEQGVSRLSYLRPGQLIGTAESFRERVRAYAPRCSARSPDAAGNLG